LVRRWRWEVVSMRRWLGRLIGMKRGVKEEGIAKAR
jgi:hypothetical protein